MFTISAAEKQELDGPAVKTQKIKKQLTCNDLQPFLISSFRSLAATPYFLLSLELLIFTGLLFLKSPNMFQFVPTAFSSSEAETERTARSAGVMLPPAGSPPLLLSP